MGRESSELLEINFPSDEISTVFKAAEIVPRVVGVSTIAGRNVPLCRLPFLKRETAQGWKMVTDIELGVRRNGKVQGNGWNRAECVGGRFFPISTCFIVSQRSIPCNCCEMGLVTVSSDRSYLV